MASDHDRNKAVDSMLEAFVLFNRKLRHCARAVQQRWSSPVKLVGKAVGI